MTSLCPVMSAEVSSSSAGLGKGCSWLMARWCSYSLPCPRQYQDSPVRWFHNPRLGCAMLRAIMLTEPWTMGCVLACRRRPHVHTEHRSRSYVSAVYTTLILLPLLLACCTVHTVVLRWISTCGHRTCSWRGGKPSFVRGWSETSLSVLS